MTKRIHKAATIAALALVAAVCSLTFKPIRAWASQEGSYIYHQFFLNGPAVFYGASSQFTGSDGTARLGVSITTGTPAAMTGVASMRFLGAQAAKPATSNAGDFYWDTVQNTLAMSTCTAANTSCWIKAYTGTQTAGQPSAWTLY